MRRGELCLERLTEELARLTGGLVLVAQQLEQAMAGVDALRARFEEGRQHGAAELIECLAEARLRLEGLRTEVLESWSGRLSKLADLAEDLRRELNRQSGLTALGELSASVAHEIRNPLCGILLSVEVLKTKMDGTDSRRALLDNLHREAERMEAIVENLLHFARHYEPRPVACRLGEVVGRSIESVRSHLGKNRMDVRVDRAVADCAVELDPDLMQQVFSNLLLNSVDACPPGSTIRVGLAARGSGEVAVAFRDTGQGIPPDLMGRIFEPFFTSKPKGIGLGLSVSKKIVEAHNGRIEVSSEPGKGATFTVVVPCRAGGQQARVAA
jgi:signal transduction histidine kinase